MAAETEAGPEAPATEFEQSAGDTPAKEQKVAVREDRRALPLAPRLARKMTADFQPLPAVSQTGLSPAASKSGVRQPADNSGSKGQRAALPGPKTALTAIDQLAERWAARRHDIGRAQDASLQAMEGRTEPLPAPAETTAPGARK
jgi:hypothetical protein